MRSLITQNLVVGSWRAAELPNRLRKSGSKLVGASLGGEKTSLMSSGSVQHHSGRPDPLELGEGTIFVCQRIDICC